MRALHKGGTWDWRCLFWHIYIYIYIHFAGVESRAAGIFSLAKTGYLKNRTVTPDMITGSRKGTWEARAFGVYGDDTRECIDE